jgi:hypothetical protein
VADSSGTGGERKQQDAHKGVSLLWTG